MAVRTDAITVKQVPEILSLGQVQDLLRELKPSLNVNRPCLVIDCSILRRFDTATLHLLLCCLEEAMKRNGDVRLAGISPEGRVLMKSTGADRLFRIFDLSAEAERSFDGGRPDGVLHGSPFSEVHR